MISRRCSIASLASGGDWSISPEIFSMIVVLVQVNLGGAPSLAYFIYSCYLLFLAGYCQEIGLDLGMKCSGFYWGSDLEHLLSGMLEYRKAHYIQVNDSKISNARVIFSIFEKRQQI